MCEESALLSTELKVHDILYIGEDRWQYCQHVLAGGPRVVFILDTNACIMSCRCARLCVQPILTIAR